ncbi:MAG: SH3 domain-containing protein [Pseudomonadota bacterium]
MSRVLTAVITVCLVLFSTAGWARKAPVQLTVADPYLELRTGPHSGYPVTQIADRGEPIEVLKRRTDWYKIRTVRDYVGWVSREDLARTILSNGDEVILKDAGLDELGNRRLEMGFMTGDFGGANVLTGYGALALSPNLALELQGSQALGRVSNSLIGQARMVNTFFPRWRASPYFGIGAGVISTSPNATLVQVEDRTDPVATATFGVRAYLTRRFMARAEYNGYVVLTEREENEEIFEWKLGFSFFF